MKIGVVVGRFQTPMLTVAHKQLLKVASESNDRLAIFLLDTHISLTDANPIPYLIREAMLEQFIGTHIKCDYEIIPLMEQKYSSVLVAEIDEELLDKYGYQSTYTLYQGENSFPYKGICNVEKHRFSTGASSTSLRALCYDHMHSSYKELHGIIHSMAHRKSVCHNFVVTIIRRDNGILVSTPPGMKLLCIPTAPLSVVDDSMEDSCKSLIKELAPDLVVSEPTYLKGFKIDDWRLRNTDDYCYYHVFYSRSLSGKVGELKIHRPPFKTDLFEHEYRPIIEFLSK